MKAYDTVIGLEVHAQLLTRTKIFCGCSTQSGLPPNTSTCPVCTGMPGTLPVLNRKVVDLGIMLGLATGCRIASRCIFARKNYFYPDLPKGYQITQYEHPLCEGGTILIETGQGIRRIGITRIHMEEDAGKTIHDDKAPSSYVDYNRSGVPLLEIVSEPDITSSDEAVAYLRELRQILMYLGICDGNMEEGSFRCDANVSVKPAGSSRLGTRTELKNMNSFRNVQRALQYEIERHIEIRESGGEVVQETLLWDPSRSVTASMRSKEESRDYRYFPEPDLVPVEIDTAWIDGVRSGLPELPFARRKRFIEQYGLPAYDAGVLTQAKTVADYYEECVRLLDKPKELSNWIMTEVMRVLNEQGIPITGLNVSPKMLTGLIVLIKKGSISGSMAKEVFAEMAATGESAESIVEKRGIGQISDEQELQSLAQEIINSHPDEARKYCSGKTGLLGFFVGMLMKATQGEANPKLASRIMKELLEG
ncbi:MAG: Asp-tRNA(Asn)/Glu-tRNA(Gln) amidotransferase subunit GatB [Desulfomonilia bacterium]|jgi:aspartyl-tRNA(Asn)/glutamyl-tRNA(Gln) amidotransferase subunit B|nr:Asp-tRNA(Asn)/Glu-tRNA(Gln) amidotransferase subunit GatB [Deltaproteobacteria bacterium]MDX9762151.1 Asp-tRNA(Asn)/Glu-tRNA(Gln) amidotransferase subunit GatB [Desulfomonilia bacterium]